MGMAMMDDGFNLLGNTVASLIGGIAGGIGIGVVIGGMVFTLLGVSSGGLISTTFIAAIISILISSVIVRRL